MDKRTENCAYYRLDLLSEDCQKEKCNGVSQTCFVYITPAHLKEFHERFGGYVNEKLLKLIEETE